MELEYTQTLEGITYRLYIEQEELQVRGNALVSGDSKADKRAEDRILKALDDGNTWAWCTVKCTATIEGVDLEGVDYLGACSYKDVKAFIRKGGYYDDMRDVAKENLLEKLRDAAEAFNTIRGAL